MHFHKERFLSILLLIAIFSSCSVINVNQEKNIKALASAIKTTATVPGVLAKQYYDINTDMLKLNLSLQADTGSRIESLQNIVDAERNKDSIVNMYNSSYSVFSTYADLLLVLINDTAQNHLTKQNAAFIATFDTALVKYNSYTSGQHLPLSLGGLISSVINFLGTARIKHLQRKYLLQLVTKSDSLISLICDNYLIIDHHIDSSRIPIDRTTIQNDYSRFLIRLKNTPGNDNNFYSYYKEYDPMYYNWLYKLDILQQLDNNNVAAFRKLKVAHATLLNDLNKRATKGELFNRIKDFYGSVNNVADKYRKLQKDLTPSKNNHE